VESYRELVMVAVLSFVAGFLTAYFVRRPVATGSPEELPVLGKPVVTIANPQVPEMMVNETRVMDGRAHAPSTNGQPAGDSPQKEPGPAKVSM
jgi:hypothetical protein